MDLSPQSLGYIKLLTPPDLDLNEIDARPQFSNFHIDFMGLKLSVLI